MVNSTDSTLVWGMGAGDPTIPFSGSLNSSQEGHDSSALLASSMQGLSHFPTSGHSTPSPSIV